MPFVQTAQVFDGEENYTHYAGFRCRVIGFGNMRTRFYSLDKIDSVDMRSLTLSETNAREPTMLGNFVSQRAMLYIYTDAIDEFINISRLIIWTKPMWTQAPFINNIA